MTYEGSQTPACGTPGHVLCHLCSGPHEGCAERACECITAKLEGLRAEVDYWQRAHRDQLARAVTATEALQRIDTRIPPSALAEPLAYEHWEIVHRALSIIRSG